MGDTSYGRSFGAPGSGTSGADVSVDDSGFDNIVGDDVQAALDSVDGQLGGGGAGSFLLDGFPRSFWRGQWNNSNTALANRGEYVRIEGSGTITKIGIHVSTQAGNICVAVFANSGAGRAAVPGARKGTSGSVACPAVGYQEVALTGSVDVEDGDWFYFGSDNAGTVVYCGSATLTTDLTKGLSGHRDAEFPAPATAGALTWGAARQAIMVGVDL